MTVRYFDWMEFIWTTDLSPEAKLISAYLTRFMNKDKDIAWPSQARIMGETGLKKATLNRRLIELEESGFLIRDSGNSKKTTRYILQVPNSLTERLLNNPTVSQGDHEQSHTETRVVSQGDSNISNTITPLIHQKEYSDSVPQKSPDCPYPEIVALYHQTLPELPKVEKLTDARKTTIRKIWREDLKELDAWGHFFTYVRSSEFLMGNVAPINGRRVFKANLEWITKPANFVKISEEFYHG